jgi:hypothetical protein
MPGSVEGDSMQRLRIVLCCCLSLSGCAGSQLARPTTARIPTDFKARQKYLLTEMDANAVYYACQELVRAKRAGELPRIVYFCDDPAAIWSVLPKAIRDAEPTALRVENSGVGLWFASPEGGQDLTCLYSEFGEFPGRADGNRGSATRSHPDGIDMLTGKETLDYLNATYEVIMLNVRPGLIYNTVRDGSPHSLEEARETDAVSIERIPTRVALQERRLLYKTDHRKLLKACRDALQDFNAGRFNRAQIHLRGVVADARAAEDIRHVPEPIKKLEPAYVWFQKSRVTVALINAALDLTGIEVYAEGEGPSATEGKLKLLDGMWFCDPGLAEDRPDYPEYLKALEKEPISFSKWRARNAASPR